MKSQEINATITYPPIEKENYHWIELSVPIYGNEYPRGATEWELECLETANRFMNKLVKQPGFIDLFISNNFHMKKSDIVKLYAQKGITIDFPETREYREPFTWWWCQLQEGGRHPGHIIDGNGWIYDRTVIPEISISLNGKKYMPFDDDEHFVGQYNSSLAWDVCVASAYNVPELYSITKRYPDKYWALDECAFSAEEDAGLYNVMDFLYEEVFPLYEIVLTEDTIRYPSGKYPIYFVDREHLHDLIKMNKKKIKEIIRDTNATQ